MASGTDTPSDVHDVAAADVVLVGCGDLGSRIGLRLAHQGYDVLGLRRRAELVPAGLRGLSMDITDESVDLPDLHAGLLVVALTADQRDAAGYERTYLVGMKRALEAATRHGQPPRRAVLISSTSVYGAAEGDVDEHTPRSPSSETGRVLMQAEDAFLQALPHGSVVRPTGLYGPGLGRWAQQVREGQNSDPGRWTNRIHRDDAASAVVHLLTGNASPASEYIATDDEPATAGQVRADVAALLGVDWPPAGSVSSSSGGIDGAVEPHGKRLSNARLRATGWVPAYPSHREGCGAAIAREGSGD